MNKIIAAIAQICFISSMIVSCQKENIKMNDSGITLQARTASTDTKVIFNDEISKVNIKWRLNDAISVFNADGTHRGELSCIDIKNDIATFKGQNGLVLEDNANYTFVYPYINTTTLSDRTFNYSNLTQISNGDMTHCNNICYMSSRDYKYTDRNTPMVTFSQELTMLTIDLPKPTDYSFANDGAPNYASINLSNGERIDITLKNFGNAWENSNLKLYCMVSPTQNKPTSIEIDIYTNTALKNYKVTYQTSNTTSSWDPGKRYNLKIGNSTAYSLIPYFTNVDFTAIAPTPEAIPNIVVIASSNSDFTAEQKTYMNLRLAAKVTPVTLILPKINSLATDLITPGLTNLDKIILPAATSLPQSTLYMVPVRVLIAPLVTFMDIKAVYNATPLHSLILSNIESIGRRAIANCPNLRFLELGTNNSKEINVGDEMFVGTNTEKIDLHLGSAEAKNVSGYTWRGYTFKSISIRN